MVAVFILDIFVFSFPSYVPEGHSYHWKSLESHLSRLVICLTDVRPIREGQPPRTLPLQSSLT